MKIIGWSKKGNVVRFALGEDDLEEWWGDDWDDAPYEHNASDFPYSEYISEYVDVAFKFDVNVMEPADDWHYGGNSPYCMDDFQRRKAPILIVSNTDDYPFNDEYSLLLGSDSNDIAKIYMGDDVDTLEELYEFRI